MEVLHKKFKPHELDGDWVLLIGNFDGVHLGHHALLQKLLKAQAKYQAKSAVLTFDPHPKMLLQPHIPFQHIYDEQTKLRLLASSGIDACFVIPFTHAFSKLTAQEFLTKLFDFITIKKIIVGYDFNFGRDRQGSSHVLQEEMNQRGIEFSQLPPVKLGETTASSTMIRRLLYEGDFTQAENLLGRPWEIHGTVQQGRQLGRELGFPTLNLFPEVLLPIRYGAYLAEVFLGEERWPAVCNIGHAPTVNSPLIKAEAHLFGFDRDAYGEEATIRPLEFLRDEQRFESLEALKNQIERDAAKAKDYFQI